jgi:hypothetical protein
MDGQLSSRGEFDQIGAQDNRSTQLDRGTAGDSTLTSHKQIGGVSQSLIPKFLLHSTTFSFGRGGHGALYWSAVWKPAISRSCMCGVQPIVSHHKARMA